MVWLKSKEIPKLKVEQFTKTLKIRQEGDIFIFPIEIQLKLRNGTYLTKTINIHNKEQVLQLAEGEFEAYLLDPNHKLLLTTKQ